MRIAEALIPVDQEKSLEMQNSKKSQDSPQHKEQTTTRSRNVNIHTLINLKQNKASQNIESLEQEIDLDEGEVTEKKQTEGTEEDHIRAV